MYKIVSYFCKKKKKLIYRQNFYL